MTYEELREIALAKIEKALTMELPAETTVQYIKALSMFEPKSICKCDKESVKV